jgi:hypothetical protein
MSATFDPLKEFLKFVLDSEELMEKAASVKDEEFQDYLNGVPGFKKFYLYNDGEFQIQIFQCPPNFIVPEHTHPNVDSYEVYMGGSMCFSHGGNWVLGEYEKIKYFKHRDYYCIRVRPEDPHGGVIGPKGGRFMSVQRWINGTKPSCVGSDYTGFTVSAEHVGDVTFGKAAFKEQISYKDAATLEELKPVFKLDENGEVCDVSLPKS